MPSAADSITAQLQSPQAMDRASRQVAAQQLLSGAQSTPGAPAAASSQAVSSTPAGVQAQQGAVTTSGQAQSQGQVQTFNAPKIILPPQPTTREVLDGLAKSMSARGVNEYSAQQVYSLHQKIVDAQRAMMDAALARSTAAV